MRDDSLPPTPQELIELATAYQRAKTLFALVELGLPTLLADLLSIASEETNRKLLRDIYERLQKAGAVIISGWILDDARTYTSWLADAGFVEIERKRYYPPMSVIVGRKPFN